MVQSWADREKIEHYEVSVMDRGFLAEPISESDRISKNNFYFINLYFHDTQNIILGYLANKLAAPPSSGRGLFRNKDEMS